MLFKSFWRKNKTSSDKKSEIINQTGSFKYKTVIELRFADIDMMGHVNNATYFTFLEIARTKYWQQAIHWDWKTTGVVIGNASIDYIKPIFLEDKISIYVKTSRIGNTSFDLSYLLVKTVNGEEVVCSKGKTVCVAYDYNSKMPTPIPDTDREKMIAFEQLT
jgi:acyl-CoA thioester hydrolase